MGFKIDLTGQKFGELTVVGFVGNKAAKNGGRNRPVWKCVCSCGSYCNKNRGALRSSCRGCRECRRLWQSKIQHTPINGVVYKRRSWIYKYNTDGTILRKKCSRCNRWKSPSKYGKRTQIEYGLDSICLKCRKERRVDKLVNNPQYRASEETRTLIGRLASKKYGGIEFYEKDLGYTGDELIAHIESLWLPGMSWENRSEWHIDHIRPLCSFDLTDKEQAKQANALSNLRPLWAKDNLSKGSKIIETQLAEQV